MNRYHIALMIYTAVMVVVTDFLTGVMTAIALYAAACAVARKRSESTDDDPDMGVEEKKGVPQTA